MKKTFSCVLTGAGPDHEFPLAELPFDAATLFGRRGRIPVVVTIGTVSQRLSLAPTGGTHVLSFSGPSAKRAGIRVGERVRITVETDAAERVVEVPPDLARAFTKRAKAAWDALAYSHRKEHAVAIADAKRPETRARRIEKTIAMLEGGAAKSRPAPSHKPVATRMHLKAGANVVVLDAPKGVSLDIPTTTKLAAGADAIVLFAADRKQLATRFAKLAKVLAKTTAKTDPMVWLAYPKTASPLASDLSRDHGWESVLAFGLRPVTQVAVDDTWSALRFRR